MVNRVTEVKGVCFYSFQPARTAAIPRFELTRGKQRSIVIDQFCAEAEAGVRDLEPAELPQALGSFHFLRQVAVTFGRGSGASAWRVWRLYRDFAFQHER